MSWDNTKIVLNMTNSPWNGRAAVHDTACCPPLTPTAPPGGYSDFENRKGRHLWRPQGTGDEEDSLVGHSFLPPVIQGTYGFWNLQVISWIKYWVRYKPLVSPWSLPQASWSDELHLPFYSHLPQSQEPSWKAVFISYHLTVGWSSWKYSDFEKFKSLPLRNN